MCAIRNGSGFRASGSEAVDVLIEVRGYRLPHGVQDEIDPLPTCQFGRRDKVTVSRYKNDLVHLFFKGERGDIKPDPNVDALLTDVIFKVIVRQGIESPRSIEERLEYLCPQPPGPIFREAAEPESHFPELFQFFMEGQAELGSR
jgi:hypothetical protein